MRGLTVWLTGLSSAGKSTISERVQRIISNTGFLTDSSALVTPTCLWLDGDVLRHHCWPELGFSRDDRDANVLRIARLAAAFTEQGHVVLVSAISPYTTTRAKARRIIQQVGAFFEVYVDAPLDVLVARDIKGLYRKYAEGAIQHLTGLDDPYEGPIAADLVLHTDIETVDQSVGQVLELIKHAIREDRRIHAV